MAAGRRQLKTMCPMNCHPTQCGMLVEVEHERIPRLEKWNSGVNERNKLA